jgi:cation transport ATPase
MDDSVLNRFLTPGSSFQELLPVAVLFMIIWCMVWVALLRMDMFPRRAAVVLSICVTLLALIGIREEQLEWISRHYAAMAIAMLVTLAAAIRFFWRKAVNEKEKE